MQGAFCASRDCMTTLRFIAAAALVLAPVACERKSESAPPAPPGSPAATAEAPQSAHLPAPTPGDISEMTLPPWRETPISASDIPRIYAEVWRAAENRTGCALLAPRGLSAEMTAATPRKATFSGGWAVAYDLPQERSAFGIAGSGTNAWDPGIYADWPHNMNWSDGSSVGYGPEGGSGPNWLAYVKVRGQQCLYNVWSRRGKVHLEQIIDSLRIVIAADD